MSPLSGLRYQAMSFTSVDLPDHDGHTRAVLVHPGICSEKLLNNFLDLSSSSWFELYVKDISWT